MSTAALLRGLAASELSLHRGRTKHAPSPGSLSRCFLPPLTGPASLNFKEQPCHKRKVKLLCSSLPFSDGRLLSDKAVLSVPPFSASLRGCWVQDSAQCMVLSPILASDTVRSGIGEDASWTQCFPATATQQEGSIKVKCRVLPTCQLLPCWDAPLQGPEPWTSLARGQPC